MKKLLITSIAVVLASVVAPVYAAPAAVQQQDVEMTAKRDGGDAPYMIAGREGGDAPYMVG
ncbi:hypothetical protein D3C85_1238380 [compost metagenome]